MNSEERRLAGTMWGCGDYAQLAEILAPAAAIVADRVGPGSGRALDLGAGTGTLAVKLAQAGWQTSALDISPTLIRQGRARTAELGLEIAWIEDSLDDLPFTHERFALVASSFGLIFATKPQQALSEISRVLGPGGRLLLTSWPRDGYIATMTDAMAAFMPPSAPTSRPFGWGDMSTLHGWLSEHFTGVETTVHQLPWQFDDVATAVEFLFENSPGHLAAATMAGGLAHRMKEAVARHLADVNGSTGPVDLRIKFLLTTAKRR